MPLYPGGAKMKMKLKILRIHIEYHKKESALKIFMGEKWPLNGNFSPIFSCCPTKDQLFTWISPLARLFDRVASGEINTTR